MVACLGVYSKMDLLLITHGDLNTRDRAGIGTFGILLNQILRFIFATSEQSHDLLFSPPLSAFKSDLLCSLS